MARDRIGDCDAVQAGRFRGVDAVDRILEGHGLGGLSLQFLQHGPIEVGGGFGRRYILSALDAREERAQSEPTEVPEHPRTIGAGGDPQSQAAGARRVREALEPGGGLLRRKQLALAAHAAEVERLAVHGPAEMPREGQVGLFGVGRCAKPCGPFAWRHLAPVLAINLLPGEEEGRLGVENQAVEIEHEDSSHGLSAGDGMVDESAVGGQWRAAGVSGLHLTVRPTRPRLPVSG